MSEPIWSPCKRVCVVDPAQPLCVGCFRTLDELGRWTKMSREEHMAVKAQLKSREDAYRKARGLKPAS